MTDDICLCLRLLSSNIIKRIIQMPLCNCNKERKAKAENISAIVEADAL